MWPGHDGDNNALGDHGVDANFVDVIENEQLNFVLAKTMIR